MINRPTTYGSDKWGIQDLVCNNCRDIMEILKECWYEGMPETFHAPELFVVSFVWRPCVRTQQNAAMADRSWNIQGRKKRR